MSAQFSELVVQSYYLNKTITKQLKKMDPAQIGSLMGISESLSLLNWERYKKWRTPFTSENSRQAMYMFEGDTYKGLNANSFSSDDINFSQQKVRILSGLYGLLRPMDLIMPYRLEMGTKLSNDQGPDLYSFWKTCPLLKFSQLIILYNYGIDYLVGDA